MNEAALKYVDMVLDNAYRQPLDERRLLLNLFEIDTLAESRGDFVSRASTVGWLALRRGMYGPFELPEEPENWSC